jgi:endonuclease/exonuclease/phosphatase (EEP) superfamily protein YafD
MTQTAIRKRTTDLGLWLLVAPFAIWALVRLLGIQLGYPFLQLVSFTPYVAFAALLVPPVAVMARRWPAAVVAALAATALIACVIPRATADGGRLPTGPALRVMAANMLEGGADPAALVKLVEDQRVDLLALQEFTPEAERALNRAGLDGKLPNRVIYPRPGVGGSALYSRLPLFDDGVRMNPRQFGQARGILTMPGAAPLAVESVHTCAPVEAGSTGCWEGSFRDQPPATVDGQVRVLLGDFNATLDHAEMRRLIATGYRDAADVTGDGLDMTWPYDKLFPRVALDHVLADRRVGVRRFAVTAVPRSDHRAVFAELVLPPG